MHLKYLKKTLSLACRGLGHVAPNPMVGALVVKNDKIIGRGYHKKYGGPHAEVYAIKQAGDAAKGSTLYCSLEPCCHTKKQTPPCTKLIQEKKIKTVVIAAKDPNPKVAGKGIKFLRSIGVNVIYDPGALEDAENKLNEVYRKNILTGMPFVHLKMAMTLDAKIADHKYSSKWISDEVARKEVHHLRGIYDAICIGSKTLEQDNPSLTIRYGLDKKYLKPKIIILGKERPKHKKLDIFQNHDSNNIFYIQAQTARTFQKKISRLGVHSLLVEGGAAVSSFMLEYGLIDKMTIYQASKVLGPGIDAFRDLPKRPLNKSKNFKLESCQKLGNQTRLTFYPDAKT